VGLLAAGAILICNIQILLQMAAWLCIAGVVIFQWRKLNTHWHLQHHGGEDNTRNLWTVQSGADDDVEGMLLQQGYRSACLLVLVIGSETGRRVHRPVWIDSVSATQFSYLNMQLLFNTKNRR